MLLPLPRLDDRRWPELVEEGRALVPLHAPEWTDHNASDPGITFVELFAWLAEMQVFQLDQVPERHRRKFLALLGVRQAPPAAARTVVRFDLPPGTPRVHLPAGVECEQPAPAQGSGPAIRFRTLDAVEVLDARLAALSVRAGGETVDVTERWRRRQPFAPFGEDPTAGATLVLALDGPLPVGIPADVVMSGTPAAVPASPGTPAPAGVAWELLTGPGRWRRLDAAAGEVADETRALTSDGRVRLTAPVAMQRVPGPGGARYLVRARLLWSRYDAAPELRDVAVNGVGAEQTVALTERWTIAAGATVIGVPRPGRHQRFALQVAQGEVSRLEVVAGDAGPEVLVLAYAAPSATGPGSLDLEAAGGLQVSTGAPGQAVELREPPVDAASVAVWTHDDRGWEHWSLRPDLDASGRRDRHVTLDATRGRLRFGDGRHGLVPGAGAVFVVTGRTTLAQRGNVPAGAVTALSATAHNDALLPPRAARARPVNPVPATGGAAAEPLERAEARAGAAAERATRAVTIDDYEKLAAATPGVRLARVIARANVHPGLACVEAVGVVTVVAIPFLPPDRPRPSAATLRAVGAHLAPHRLVGTRVEVVGPEYTEVRVRATLRRRRAAVAADVARQVREALDTFLHPLRGGPEGTGWPLGRDVVRSEILQLIDELAGVDHVLRLALTGPRGESCGDLCLTPLSLTVAGPHTIDVVDQ